MKQIEIRFIADVDDDFGQDFHLFEKLESIMPYRVYNPSYRELGEKKPHKLDCWCKDCQTSIPAFICGKGKLTKKDIIALKKFQAERVARKDKVTKLKSP